MLRGEFQHGKQCALGSGGISGFLQQDVGQNDARRQQFGRFRNYAFIRVDVRPGALLSEMDVTAVDEYGREFDKLTYRRQVRA